MTKTDLSFPRSRGPARTVAAALACCAAALLCACGQAPKEMPVQLADVAPQSDDPAVIARQVVADLLSVPVDEITLVSIQAKDFGDPSLGCPAPGMAYPQVITPGHRVIVEGDGRRFDVRVSGKFGKICRKPSDNASGAPRDDRGSPVTSQVERARSDLAAKLGLDASAIVVADVTPWESGRELGGCVAECDRADCGYRVGLVYDGRRYDYHARGERATPCPALGSI